MDPQTLQLSLLVPRDLVKTLKTALDKHNKLDKNRKIIPSPRSAPTRQQTDTAVLSQSRGKDGTTTETRRDAYLVPTTITVGCDATLEEVAQVKTELLKEIGMASHEDDIQVTTININITTTTTNPQFHPNPTALKAPIHAWLTYDLPPPLLETLNISTASLLDALPTRYTIYPPLLLLAPNTFTTPPWPRLLAALSPAHRQALYARLCASLKVTHVAINAPIPAHVSDPTRSRSPSPSPSSASSDISPAPTNAAGKSETTAGKTANLLRLPTALLPLHGAFGPLPSPSSSPNPTPADFASALWVSTRQNAIYQTWAPLHTMFSRGNFSEKARVLQFASSSTPSSPSIPDAFSPGGPELEGRDGGWGGQCTAVDLYAGIGYFAFSYAKSTDVARVLGWEVSGWSVEGLRRGAGGNGWGVRVVAPDGSDVGGEPGWNGWAEGEEKIVVFREDNLNALRRVEATRAKLPPVRHVNCGLLPSSRGSWEVSVGVLDPVERGWIHAHENIAVKEMESTRDEIVAVFEELVDGRRKVECQHLERVKTYRYEAATKPASASRLQYSTKYVSG